MSAARVQLVHGGEHGSEIGRVGRLHRFTECRLRAGPARCHERQTEAGAASV